MPKDPNVVKEIQLLQLVRHYNLEHFQPGMMYDSASLTPYSLFYTLNIMQSKLRLITQCYSVFTVNGPVTVFSSLCRMLIVVASINKWYSCTFSSPEAHLVERALHNLFVDHLCDLVIQLGSH